MMPNRNVYLPPDLADQVEALGLNVSALLQQALREVIERLHSQGSVWQCPRCGSSRWVAASLTGPVSHGGRAIKQCVPCGHYSSNPVTDEDRSNAKTTHTS